MPTWISFKNKSNSSILDFVKQVTNKVFSIISLKINQNKNTSILKNESNVKYRPSYLELFLSKSTKESNDFLKWNMQKISEYIEVKKSIDGTYFQLTKIIDKVFLLQEDQNNDNDFVIKELNNQIFHLEAKIEDELSRLEKIKKHIERYINLFIKKFNISDDFSWIIKMFESNFTTNNRTLNKYQMFLINLFSKKWIDLSI